MLSPQQLLARILPLALVYSLTLDPSLTSIDQNRAWSRLRLNFPDAPAPVSLFYDQHPRGWYQVLDYLYIPREHIQDNVRYLVRFRAVVGGVEAMRGMVVCGGGEGGVWVGDGVFGYGDHLGEGYYGDVVRVNGTEEKGRVGTEQTQVATVQQSLPSVQQLSQQPSQTNLSTAVIQAPGYSQQRAIQSIFSRLPGPQQLDSLILSADALPIVKTIQNVIQSQLQCGQKVAYLQDLLGRIQSAVALKQLLADRLAVIIQTARLEVERLQGQVSRLRDQVQKLGVNKLRAQLNTILIELQQTYNQFNSVDSQIQPKYASIAGWRTQAQILRTRADINRQQLPLSRLQLLEANNTILRLERELAQVRARRGQAEATVRVLEGTIRGYDGKVLEEGGRVGKIEAEIDRREAEADQIRIAYQKLQVEIQRQNTDIARKQRRQAEIKLLIPNLEQRANIEKAKMDTSQLQKVNRIVTNLETSLPRIQQQVDQSNFICNKINSAQTAGKGENTTYSMATKDFIVYLQSLYRIKPQANNLKTNRVSLTRISILDSVWGSNFGRPFQHQSYAGAKQFAFNEDFNCLSPSRLQTGTGVIRSINRRFIQVQVQGRSTRLNLGVCSRLQSTQPLPRIGQTIYFRGRQLQRGEFNLYKGSCV